MLHRPARILLAVFLILALALPIATWFWTLQSNCNGLAIRLENGGIRFAWGRHIGHNWGLNLNYTASESHLIDFLQFPHLASYAGTPALRLLDLPWWTLDGLLFSSTATAYWLTHRKTTPPHAFPIEPLPPPAQS